jgi:hypothetical protein
MNAASGGKGSSKSQLAGSGSGKDGTKFRTSSLLGENGRELYASLSPGARDKFRDLVRARMEKHPELTQEQNSDYAQKVFAKIKASDSAGRLASRRRRSREPNFL